jgi:hypothetical protein
MAWKFHRNGTPMLLSPAEMPATNIHLSSGDDPTLRPIEQKSVFDSHHTLDVWPTPSGDNKKQFTQCLARSNMIAEGVRLNHMAQNEALMGYRHIWLPSVGYPLACWGLSEAQLHRVEMNAVNAFLPKMGFRRKTAQAIIQVWEGLDGRKG